MLCPQCGRQNDTFARFCSQCGCSLALPSLSPSYSMGSTIPSGRSVGVKVGCIVATVLALILLGVAALLFFIFSGIKNSEANRLAVEALRQNVVAQQTLGEIQKVGWPLGNISVKGGGWGQASFSMSVKGTKARGKYYATLYRENGIWRITSSRLQIESGPSFDLGAYSRNPALHSPTSPPLPRLNL